MTGLPADIFRIDPLPEHDQLLVSLYEQLSRSVDDLAYSKEFEHLYEQLRAAGDKRAIGDVYRRLLNLRKAGRLSRVA